MHFVLMQHFMEMLQDLSIIGNISMLMHFPFCLCLRLRRSYFYFYMCVYINGIYTPAFLILSYAGHFGDII